MGLVNRLVVAPQFLKVDGVSESECLSLYMDMNISHMTMFLIVSFIYIVKSCPSLSPPQNGALVCTTHAHDSRKCAVFCQNGTDFEFNPPMLYNCETGHLELYLFPWQQYDQKLPGPNCSGKKTPSGSDVYSVKYKINEKQVLLLKD